MKSKTNDDWIIAEGLHEGQRLVVRMNIGARPLIDSERYPYKVGIAIPFKSPLSDGMPNEVEIQRYARIEDTIVNRFEVDHAGVPCIVITTQGMREFVVYSKTDNVSDIIEDASLHFPEYDFQHIVEYDKNWDEFRYWSERLGH